MKYYPNSWKQMREGLWPIGQYRYLPVKDIPQSYLEWVCKQKPDARYAHLTEVAKEELEYRATTAWMSPAKLDLLPADYKPQPSEESDDFIK